MTVAYQILWLFYTLGGRGCVVCLLSWSLLLLLTTLEPLSAQEKRTHHSETRVIHFNQTQTCVLDHASENDWVVLD